MPIKFSELSPNVTSLANEDLFAVTDASEGGSVSINFASLKGIIVDENTFTENASLIVSAINAYDSGNGTNTLNATTLNGFPSTYYLNYNSLSNRPTIPTALDNLDNDSGFIKLEAGVVSPANPTGEARVVYQRKVSGTQLGKTTITTSFIPEGENLYYRDNRVESFFDENFGDYYNSFAATFDEGNVKDSYYDTVGEVRQAQITGGETNIIRIPATGTIPGSIDTRAQTERFPGYRAGQVVRVFGADPTSRELLSSAQVATALSIVGFRTETQISSNPYNVLKYRVAEWDYSTGQISSGITEMTAYVGVPGTVTDPVQVENYLAGDPNRILSAFGIENFININFTSGPTPGRGILIYRRVGTSGAPEGVSKLIAVLGPKDVEVGKWIDYYTDDVLDYSGKNQEDNSYLPINTVHFRPLIEPAVAREGWMDNVITGVKYSDPINPVQSTYIDITLQDPMTSSAGVWVCHDDTSKIQSAINNNSVAGRKAVQLNPKNYMVSELVVPSNFGINGFAYNTRMSKIPWSGYSTDAPSGRIIRAAAATGASNISLVGFDIDGNSTNSFLFDDSSVSSRNYIVDWGQRSDSILIDKVRISKPIGGGIWASDGTNFKIFASEAINSGLSDRYLFSPLIVDGGENTSIVSNRFQNFTNYVDTSITNKGVIEGNIISNCGTGLLIYGSRFLVSAPNILVGPADEFLPNPDSYNSEYDSINIDLTGSILTQPVTSYDSDPFKYQENGDVYDLTQTAGVEYKIFAVEKLPDGSENIWLPSITGVHAGALEMNERSESENPPQEGGFQFNIPASSVSAIKIAGGAYTLANLQDAGATINYTNAEGVAASVAGNPNHVGLGWAASVNQWVVSGIVTNTAQSPGTWSTQYVDPGDGLTYADYTIDLTSYKYLAIDRAVRPVITGTFSHQNFSAGNTVGGVPAQFGTIKQIIDLDAQNVTKRIVIKWLNANYAGSASGGASGQIEVRNDFVLANGRIK